MGSTWPTLLPDQSSGKPPLQLIWFILNLDVMLLKMLIRSMHDMLDVVACSCYFNTWKVEVSRLVVQGQSRLYSKYEDKTRQHKNLSQNKNKNDNYLKIKNWFNQWVFFLLIFLFRYITLFFRYFYWSVENDNAIKISLQFRWLIMKPWWWSLPCWK